MAPIRRYLRITKYSVLEVRIYPEKPSDTPWLLSSRDPVLPRVIEEVRPKVLPKLREENENAKKKGGKKKRAIKDVASQEDFEVVMFLTETSTRHSLITKRKQFASKPNLKPTSNKLTGWLNNSDNPINVEDDDAHPTGILREYTDDAPTTLRDIPEADTSDARKAQNADEGDPLFVSSDDEDFFQTQRQAPPPKKRKRNGKQKAVAEEEEAEVDTAAEDDKKKMAINTSYDGFSIYGRVLCLIVKRKGKRAAPNTPAPPLGGSQMMENWVSTQAAQELGMNDDDDG